MLAACAQHATALADGLEQAESDEFAHQVAFALDDCGIDTLADGDIRHRIEIGRAHV